MNKTTNPRESNAETQVDPGLEDDKIAEPDKKPHFTTDGPLKVPDIDPIGNDAPPEVLLKSPTNLEDKPTGPEELRVHPPSSTPAVNDQGKPIMFAVGHKRKPEAVTLKELNEFIIKEDHPLKVAVPHEVYEELFFEAGKAGVAWPPKTHKHGFTYRATEVVPADVHDIQLV